MPDVLTRAKTLRDAIVCGCDQSELMADAEALVAQAELGRKTFSDGVMRGVQVYLDGKRLGEES